MSSPQRIGPYEVVRLLGQGAMGRVYEVRAPGAGGTLALKQLDARLAQQEWVARFTREAALLARVRHPHVLRLFELGKGELGPYLVTELLEGEDLGRVLERQGGFEARRAAAIARALCDAVAAVHEQGILHRDLKPENVMLRADGSPVLLDFGLAREEEGERLTATGTLLGTPAYMSPEQARAISPSELDVRVDVYGLGALLFSLLAGQPPFTGRTLIELLAKVLRAEPEWALLERRAAPRALQDACRVALAKERDQRYASAGALRAAIERYLSGASGA